MKLDTSGLQSTAPLFGASSELADGFSTAPSFGLPSAVDVSFNMFVIFSYPAFYNMEININWVFFLFYFSLMDFRKRQSKW